MKGFLHAQLRSMPHTFVADVSVKGEKLGRMVFVLFSDESPLQAENMRQLCTGERVCPLPSPSPYPSPPPLSFCPASPRPAPRKHASCTDIMNAHWKGTPLMD